MAASSHLLQVPSETINGSVDTVATDFLNSTSTCADTTITEHGQEVTPAG